MKNLKQYTQLLIGLLLLTATSCKKTELAPSTQQDMSTDIQQNLSTGVAQKASSGAQVYKYHNTIDLSVGWSEFNACTGEIMDITKGIWHIDFMYIINKNTFTLVDHSNVSGFKLINLTTGVEYTGSYVSNTSFTGNITGEDPIRITGAVKILLITSGGGNNGFYMADYHVTINANGEVTAYFDNYRAGCQ